MLYFAAVLCGFGCYEREPLVERERATINDQRRGRISVGGTKLGGRHWKRREERQPATWGWGECRLLFLALECFYCFFGLLVFGVLFMVLFGIARTRI